MISEAFVASTLVKNAISIFSMSDGLEIMSRNAGELES